MKKFLLLMATAMAVNGLLANNIVINHVSLTGNNTTSQYVMVKFDLSWDNSWRITSGPSNWDAAWVFIKYRIKGQTAWNHATLHYADGSGSGDGHVLPAGAAIASSNDNGAGGAYGVFVYHNSAVSQGTVSYAGTQLRWDYGVNGVPDADSADIRIYAIEMVYVPQGSFSAGSGGAETDAFFTYPDTTQAYPIGSENAIPVGAVNGQLYYHNNTGKSGDGLGPIPAAFPKGYQAFYSMKYELTQDQYIAFLSTLSDGQMAARNALSNQNLYRDGIIGSAPGNDATSNPYVPCNYISWFDLSAYLDWSALRPMTELEYEKACRGTVAPVRNEFAWGTNGLINYNPVSQSITTGNGYTLSNPGATNEGIASNYSNIGNAVWYYSNLIPGSANSANGPLRAGIFAANAGNTGRVTAGASFYGIMELSGNLSEMVVTTGLPAGRAFTGQHGNGQLTTGGDGDVNGWPFITVDGIGLRGGSFLDSYTSLMVADRSAADGVGTQVFYREFPNYGGRGVRTAP